MKKITFALMLFSVIALAQQPNSFSEVTPSNTTNSTIGSPVTVVQNTNNNRLPVIDTYTTRPSFQAAYTANCGGETLTLEDFAGLPGGVTTCGPEISSAGDANCYAAGELQDGFSITASVGDVVGITSGTIGNTIDITGANTFGDETIITFTTPTAAVGLDIWFNSDPDTRVDVLDSGGTLIESFTVTGTVGTENFFGFYSDEPVGSMVIAQLNDGGELVGNMEFGNCIILNVEENLLSNISIFPNPTSSILTIQSSAGLRIESAVLYDILGKQVSTNVVNNQIDMSALQNGVYMLTINTDSGSLTKRVVKQ